MNEYFIAANRNYLGDIISFQTSTGRIISYRKALEEINQGMIKGVTILQYEDGHQIIQSSSCMETTSQLEYLPEIYSF